MRLCYENNGYEIAAKYLANQFEILKLNHFVKNYFQEFSLDINTFPTTPKVVVDDKKLIPGRDIILRCNSGSSKEEYSLVFAHSSQQLVPSANIGYVNLFWYNADAVVV